MTVVSELHLRFSKPAECNGYIAEAVIEGDLVKAQAGVDVLRHHFNKSGNNVFGRLNSLHGNIGKKVRQEAERLEQAGDANGAEEMLRRLHLLDTH